MVRLREAHEADLHQKDTQLEQQMMTIQQLNTQLGEKDERLRRREEEFQKQLQQKETQLRLKDVELQRKTADISRLQRELQVCSYIGITRFIYISNYYVYIATHYSPCSILFCKIIVAYHVTKLQLPL